MRYLLAATIVAFTPSTLFAASCPSLARGSTGPAVSAVQHTLFDAYANFPQPTGYFGPTTEAALKQWQKEHSLEETGTVGPKTAAAMNVSLCPSTSPYSTPPSSSSKIAGSKQSLIDALLAQVKLLQAKLAALLAAQPGTSTISLGTSGTTGGLASGGGGGSGGGSSPDSGASGAAQSPASGASCAFGGQSVAHNASIIAYRSSSVPAGSVCVSETRTCANGTLSGSYQNASCSVRAAIPADVFLVAGQSNAQGAGDKSQSAAVSSSVLQFYGGQLVSGADPVGNAATGSAWPAFGNAYAGATGRAIIFVPAARGGTCQSAACSAAASSHPDNWDTGGTLFGASVTALQNALAALRASGYDPTVKGILWSQGEADAVAIQIGGEDFQTYRNALSAMVARYRSQFPSVSFYIFRTGAVPGGDDVTVRSAQEQIASADPLTKIVFRGALSFGSQGFLQTDGLHYTQQGYNLMGQTGGQNVAASRGDGSDVDTPVLGLAANGDYNGITITQGGSYTLSWATYAFSSCALNYNSTIGQGSGSIPIAGSASGSSSTGLVGTYTLACTTAAGKNISTTVTITQR